MQCMHKSNIVKLYIFGIVIYHLNEHGWSSRTQDEIRGYCHAEFTEI